MRRELRSPRGVTLRYVLRGVSASPGGTETVIKSKYKQMSLAALREIEAVDRKQMTATCAKNDLSYNRAMHTSRRVSGRSSCSGLGSRSSRRGSSSGGS